MTRKRVAAASAAVSVLLGLGWVITGSAGATRASGQAGAAVTAADVSAAERALRTASDGDVTIDRDRNGRVHFIGTEAGHPVGRPSGVSRSAAPDAAAQAHLGRYAALFGLRDAGAELAATRTTRIGATDVVRFAQRQGGVPVVGGELSVSLDADGNLVSVNGETGAQAASLTATVSTSDAARVAREAVAKGSGITAGDLRASAPTLWIYDPKLLGAPDPLAARPVWRLQVSSPADAAEFQRWTVLVDARTGGVALAFADLAHGKDRKVCDLANVRRASWTCPQAAVPVTRAEGQGPTGNAEVDSTFDISGAVYDFYHDVLGRDSVDNAGAPLVTSVRYCEPEFDPGVPPCPWDNAFWDGTQATFGDGWATDDIVAHELTHGVTQYTSNMLYYYQSGAINESFSDVMGELFDQSTYSPGDDPLDAWLIGEDVPGGAIRDMADPPALGQPDTMQSSLWETSLDAQAFDAGAVHYNSGVGNKAAYLMAAGGNFGGQSITGIGITKVAQLWYATNQLLTSGADYADLNLTLREACAQLLDAGTLTAQDCETVGQALEATLMDEPPNEPDIPKAAKCYSSQIVLDKFKDEFNRAASSSLGSSWVDGGASINGDFVPSPTAGNAMFIPGFDNVANPNGVNRLAYTSAWRALSSTYTTYLHFDHAYSFDWYPPFVDQNGVSHPSTYFDGGRVEVDVDGDGKGWLVPSSTAWTSGPGRTLYSQHPIMPSAKVFAGESRGWGSARLSLSAYKGKKVKIRFHVATDGFAAITPAYGWWLDNVRLYQCSKPPTAPTSVTAYGYLGQAKIKWGAASANGGPALGNYVVALYKPGQTSPINQVVLPTSAREYTFTKDSSGAALSYYGQDYTVTVRARNVQFAYGPSVSKTLVGTHLTHQESATTVPPGDPVVISGVLTRTDTDLPVGSVTVQLRYGPPGSPTSSYQIGPTMRTAADGSYSFTIHPTTSTDYRVYYPAASQTYMGTRIGSTIKVVVQ